MIRRPLAFLLAAVAALALVGCDDVAVPRFTATSASPAGAAATLDQLQVRGRAPMTGYDRKQFGSGWTDPDGNGCDARRDALARQAVGEPVRKGRAQCVFTADILDPYTGNVIRSIDADTDHVVALGNAWASGAWQASAAQREALANDPLNLIAVTASVNRQKKDGDAATWLPPLKEARCPYVAQQIAVKRKYQLSVTPAEREAIARVLAACPHQQLPS